MRIAIVGRRGGSNIGESFERAALREGASVLYLDMDGAEPRSRVVRSAAWRLLRRRSLRLARFERQVALRCAEFSPDLVLTTGLAPLSAGALETLRARGAACVNFSTDDPWNPEHRQGWFLDALPAYDVVFTPREANVSDFRAAGARRVEILRFGYDEDLFPATVAKAAEREFDVFFAGGADAERAKTVGTLLDAGLTVLLGGSYWDRFPETRGRSVGQVGPESLTALAARARLGLCLVRRANRDDHAMRTFELPRMGIGIVAEETRVHRELFAPHPAAAILYGNDADLPARARALIERLDPSAVASLGAAFDAAGHSYRDRLRQIIAVALGSASSAPRKR